MLNLNVWSIVWTVVNLLILFVLFRIFFFKPLKKIIDQRQAEADEAFTKAKEQEDAAKQIQTEYEEKLQAAETEKKQIIAEAHKTADTDAQHILADAKTEAKNIHDEAVASAVHEKDQIVESAKKEIAQMVVDATTKVVGTKAGADVDSELYDQFLKKAGE